MQMNGKKPWLKIVLEKKLQLQRRDRDKKLRLQRREKDKNLQLVLFSKMNKESIESMRKTFSKMKNNWNNNAKQKEFKVKNSKRIDNMPKNSKIFEKLLKKLPRPKGKEFKGNNKKK
jgi:hypothetical protein